MFSQFLAAPGAGGDGNGAGAKGFAAGDVARRIADDVDLGGGKLAAMFFFSARPGERAELVAIVVIIGKRAEFKKMPDPVMLEFQLRAARDVAGEEREHEMRARPEFLEQLKNARKQFPFPARQFERKKMHVAVEERGDVLVRRWDFVFLQNADDDAGIGHAGDLNVP